MILCSSFWPVRRQVSNVSRREVLLDGKDTVSTCQILIPNRFSRPPRRNQKHQRTSKIKLTADIKIHRADLEKFRKTLWFSMVFGSSCRPLRRQVSNASRREVLLSDWKNNESHHERMTLDLQNLDRKLFYEKQHATKSASELQTKN